MSPTNRYETSMSKLLSLKVYKLHTSLQTKEVQICKIKFMSIREGCTSSIISTIF